MGIEMKILLTPSPPPAHALNLIGIVLLLVLSAVSIVAAPLLIPQSYSWVSNYISESAAQNLTNAWVARLGFLLFGVAVLWLSTALRRRWARSAYWCHLAFGLFMISTAAFSHQPWIENVPFDAFEDVLHSFTATGMGFAFSFGVLLRLFQRKSEAKPTRAFDVLAIAVAIGMPVMAGALPSVAGITQRALFLVAYVWYGNEALLLRERRTLTDEKTS